MEDLQLQILNELKKLNANMQQMIWLQQRSPVFIAGGNEPCNAAVSFNNTVQPWDKMPVYEMGFNNYHPFPEANT